MHLTVLLNASRTLTSHDFLIRDIPGTSGRLDVVCRILLASFRTVPTFTPFTCMKAILGGAPNPPLQLQISNVNPGEFPKSELACALILKGLLFRYHMTQSKQASHWPQFSLKPQSFRDTLAEIYHPHTQIIYLIETGQPLNEIELNPEQPITLILGDDQGLPPDQEKLVYEYPVKDISIGTRSLLGSQAVSLFLLKLEHLTKKLSQP